MGRIYCLRVREGEAHEVSHVEGEPAFGRQLEYLGAEGSGGGGWGRLVTISCNPETRLEVPTFIEVPTLRTLGEATIDALEGEIADRLVLDMLRCGDADKDGIDDVVVSMFEKVKGAASGRYRMVLVSGRTFDIVLEWPVGEDRTLRGYKLGAVIGGSNDFIVRIRRSTPADGLSEDGAVELCGIGAGTVVEVVDSGPEGSEPVAIVRDGRSVPGSSYAQTFGVVFASDTKVDGRRTWETRLVKYELRE